MNHNGNNIEARLWDAADELRANSKLKSSEYSVPFLGPDVRRFLAAMAGDTSLNLPALGLQSTTLEEVLGALRKIYGLTG
jgi:hypothetical protein